MLSDREDMAAIVAGRCSLVYGSPESFLTNTTRDIILSSVYQDNIKLLVVDESHCIRKLGEGDSKSKQRAFRREYGRIGNLRALCPASTPVLALTATASKTTAEIIIKSLSMEDCTKLKEPANKKNIAYHFAKVTTEIGEGIEDHHHNFVWLAELLRDKGKDSPRHMIFFSSADVCSRVFRMLSKDLGVDAYTRYDFDNPEKNDDTNRLFAMYHSQVPAHIKDTVHKSVAQEDGHVRVILCTNAFGMGVDVKGADQVIHYGPSKDCEEYLQETGRVARAPGSQGTALLLAYPNSGARGVSKELKDYMASDKCRRVHLMQAVDEGDDNEMINTHDCCDNCRKLCMCAGDSCEAIFPQWISDIVSENQKLHTELLPEKSEISEEDWSDSDSDNDSDSYSEISESASVSNSDSDSDCVPSRRKGVRKIVLVELLSSDSELSE